jgi:hypothetical protein
MGFWTGLGWAVRLHMYIGGVWRLGLLLSIFRGGAGVGLCLCLYFSVHYFFFSFSSSSSSSQRPSTDCRLSPAVMALFAHWRLFRSFIFFLLRFFSCISTVSRLSFYLLFLFLLVYLPCSSVERGLSAALARRKPWKEAAATCSMTEDD